MPYGFERLNERSQRPNVLINFIKPLSGPDQAMSTDFLNRIAAQCYPVMNANHISVMSLEEYEPNPEFLGRNFNAGECIQLVLKNKHGQWLGFKYVQMVMMHELAHCKQMNHSRDFWQVRNGFAETMEGLWKKKYSGEGIWGRGQNLGSGSFMQDNAVEPGTVPQHLCGGTYRRRGRKRKRGTPSDATNSDRPAYAERQQRRIAKKFGKHGEGTELGDDELVRGAYEHGNRHYGKPRVAGSKRGRELRAQAALARFEAAKTEQQHARADESPQGGAEDDSDTGSAESDLDDQEEVIEGSKTYVKVCGEEDEDDVGASQEANELLALGIQRSRKQRELSIASSTHDRHHQKENSAQKDSETSDTSLRPIKSIAGRTTEDAETESESECDNLNESAANGSRSSPPERDPAQSKETAQRTAANTTPTLTQSSAISCPVCSLENESDALLCSACSNVLRPTLVKDSWHCSTEACRHTSYLNAGDAGRCGLCGGSKPARRVSSSTAPRTMSAQILRWD